MKDLLVYTADADAMAVMTAILARPLSLGIREITYDVKRHPGRDSGMYQTGAELARFEKGKYRKVLLMWDHHGSGRDHLETPEACVSAVERKLDDITWSGHRSAVVIDPELEEWLWHNTTSVHRHCGITQEQLLEWMNEFAASRNCAVEHAMELYPKEMFEYVKKDKCRKTISPADFQDIASVCSIRQWQQSNSFSRITAVLKEWFPVESASATRR